MTETEPQQLSQLSASELRQWNRMATGMEYYHNHFRHTWEILYSSVAQAVGSSAPPLSANKIINTGLQFVSQLTAHHDIEEAHIFPVLATKMPAFQDGQDMKTQHKGIHAGLDRLSAYLNECRSGERELRREEVKEILDSFGGVLWEHLEKEVQNLGADNMRKYWTLEEMRRIPF